MTSQTWRFGTGLYHQQYSYTGVKADGTTDSSVDGTISAITTTVPGRSAITSEYKYNDLRQLKSKSVTGPGQNGTQTKVYDRTYTYDRIAVDSGNRMGTRLASTGYTFGSSSRSFTYTYDEAGNISRIVTAGTSVPKAAQLKEYTYDAQGQLATEKNGSGTTFGYAYDTAGNIRSITKDGAVTKSFGYTNPSWPDLLTSVTANGATKDILYEGQTQTSDVPSSGNPVTYYNGKDYTFTWTKGRQLASATVDGKQVSYTYDMSGARSGKQVYTTSNQRTTTYTYTTLSGKVMRQQWETRNSDDTVYQAMQSLEFVYDDGNQPFAMIYKHGQTTELYYYVLNAQGDVIALLNSAGSLVASYNYGAWGNYSVHDDKGAKITKASFIGHINPLRYRGYYYDRETRLYYLQSRYYDFANCRFINADTFATTDANGFLSANMFAYCENNPVMRTDEDGEVAHIIVGAIIGVAFQYVCDVASGLRAGHSLSEALNPGTVGSTYADYIAAAASGALAASGIGAVGAVAANTMFSSVTYLADRSIKNEKVNGAEWLEATATGFISGIIGGSGANAKKVVGVINYSRNVVKTAVSPKRIAMYRGKITSSLKAIRTSLRRTFGSFCFSNLKNFFGR